MMNGAVACKVIWNKSEANAAAVLRKVTKYLSAEFGEVEIGTKSKIHIQEEQSAT
jgi:hypothetical protein